MKIYVARFILILKMEFYLFVYDIFLRPLEYLLTGQRIDYKFSRLLKIVLEMLWNA